MSTLTADFAARARAAQAAAPGPANSMVTIAEIVTIDSIPMRPIQWLWPGRIATGKTTMIAGNPGLGKSQLTLWLAAVVSTGGPWPDGGQAPAGDVLLISDEDEKVDTIRPRLHAAGADGARVHILDLMRDTAPDGAQRERGFDLSRDVPAITAALAARPAVKLLIVDPVTAFLGGTDSHKTGDVRGVLRPLERLAQQRGIAIVLVSHLNKGGSSEALMRVTGSLAFIAAARAAFLVVADREQPDRRLFLEVKNNIARKADGLVFTVEEATIPIGWRDGSITTSRIAWTGETATVTADEALAAQATAGEDRSDRDEAVDWLREALSDGPRPRKELERAATVDGLHWKTIQRGAKVMGVTITRSGFGAGSIWALPAPFRTSGPHSGHLSDVSRMGMDVLNGTDCHTLELNHSDPRSAIEGGESPSDEEAADDVV